MAAFGALLGTSGLVGLAAPAHAASAIPAGCSHPSGAAQVTCSFSFTGGTQQFTVPNGITSVDLSGWGGDGAPEDGVGYHTNTPVELQTGGRGGLVTGTLQVHAGDVLSVVVAGDGRGLGAATTGFGYGLGGVAHGLLGEDGGGGGATSISQGALPVLVAGGGGGAGNASQCEGVGIPGGRGGDAGQDGQPGAKCVDTHSYGGLSGADRKGDDLGPDGTDGEVGGGGGGGGGQIGGAGGAAQIRIPVGSGFTGSSGGGGGTNFTSSALTSATNWDFSDRTWGSNGRVTISYAAPDSTGPIANPTYSLGNPNAAGWSRGPVAVDWNWQDASSIDPSSCTKSSDSTAVQGTQTLTALCTDVWGNVGSASLPVKIDFTKPVDAPTQTQDASGPQ